MLACSACSASRPDAAQTPPVTATAAPLVQIHALIGSAACTESSQCKTLAVGASGCGGPESYLAYSAAATAEAPLQEQARRHAQQRHAEVMRAGVVSTCAFLKDPGAQCRAGACVLNPAPAPSQPRPRPPPEA